MTERERALREARAIAVEGGSTMNVVRDIDQLIAGEPLPVVLDLIGADHVLTDRAACAAYVASLMGLPTTNIDAIDTDAFLGVDPNPDGEDR